MKFGPVQQNRFGTANGAYSTVTDTEFGDSQITLADYERSLVESFFGRGQIHRGNVRSFRARAMKQFRLYPSGVVVGLNLVYPKMEKDELRLYLSETAGFKPLPGYVWFVFHDENDLWLGAERESVWRLAGRSDEEDEIYQAATEATAAENGQEATRLISGMHFIRNPVLAIERFELSGYLCEAEPTHKLFRSRASGQPFLEAHHLIPVSLHSQFKGRSLDVIENIFAMCPMCHRAVHHAQCERTLEIIDRLITARKEILPSFGISTADLFKMYSCEKIER